MEKIKYIKPREVSEGSKLNFKQIIRGVVLATVFAIICLLISAFVFTYTNISMSFVKAVSNFIFYASAFAGGLIAGFNQKSFGWLHGMLAGIIYLLMIFSICVLSDISVVKMQLPLIKFVFSAILSGVGGIVGVNIKIKKKRR